jgi:hypothetical protein
MRTPLCVRPPEQGDGRHHSPSSAGRKKGAAYKGGEPPEEWFDGCGGHCDFRVRDAAPRPHHFTRKEEKEGALGRGRKGTPAPDGWSLHSGGPAGCALRQWWTASWRPSGRSFSPEGWSTLHSGGRALSPVPRPPSPQAVDVGKRAGRRRAGEEVGPYPPFPLPKRVRFRAGRGTLPSSIFVQENCSPAATRGRDLGNGGGAQGPAASGGGERQSRGRVPPLPASKLKPPRAGRGDVEGATNRARRAVKGENCLGGKLIPPAADATTGPTPAEPHEKSVSEEPIAIE